LDFHGYPSRASAMSVYTKHLPGRVAASEHKRWFCLSACVLAIGGQPFRPASGPQDWPPMVSSLILLVSDVFVSSVPGMQSVLRGSPLHASISSCVKEPGGRN